MQRHWSIFELGGWGAHKWVLEAPTCRGVWEILPKKMLTSWSLEMLVSLFNVSFLAGNWGSLSPSQLLGLRCPCSVQCCEWILFAFLLFIYFFRILYTALLEDWKSETLCFTWKKNSIVLFCQWKIQVVFENNQMPAVFLTFLDWDLLHLLGSVNYVRNTNS